MFKNLSLEKNHFLLAALPLVAYFIAFLPSLWIQGAEVIGLVYLAIFLMLMTALAVVITVWIRKGTLYLGRVCLAFALLYVLSSLVVPILTSIIKEIF